MSKIDIDKFVAFEYKRQLQFTPSNAKNYLLMAFDKALKEQGLCYKDGEVIEIESKPANSFQISKDLQELINEEIKRRCDGIDVENMTSLYYKQMAKLVFCWHLSCAYRQGIEDTINKLKGE